MFKYRQSLARTIGTARAGLPWLLVASVSAALVGCGQKGPLVLDKPASEAPRTAPSALPASSVSPTVLPASAPR